MSRRNATHPFASATDAALPPHRLAQICKALGHPVRMQIMQLLETEDKCFCGRIVDHLPLAQSTVSQHIKCLKEAGLVLGENEGAGTCYHVDAAMLRRFLKSLARAFETAPKASEKP